MGCRLLEHAVEPTAIDRILPPGGVRKKARDICLVGAVQEAAGDMGHALMGQDDEPGQIMLEMSKLTLVVTQVAENGCVRGDHGSRRKSSAVPSHTPLSLAGFSA